MSANDKIYNIGIIGLGDNGTMHTNGFARLNNCRVAAICDKRTSARQRMMDTLKDDSVVSTSDYRKVCKMEEIDAISICTPTYFHVPIAECALENGKDILLEKPIAPTIEEVDALIIKAMHTDRIVQVGLVYRYCNLYRTVAQMVEKGDFGDIMMAYCKEYRDNFPTQWFFETAKSGGAILDKNCHHFDLFSWFIRSRPHRVYAMGGQHVVKGERVPINCAYAPDQNLKIKNPDIVDHAFVLVEYENGARANLGLCMYEKEPIEGLEIGIMGNNGAWALAKRDVKLTAGGGPLGDLREVPVDYVNDNEGIGHIGAHIQHVEFLECMKSREKPFASLLRARESMVISMAAERSIKEKREVLISEFDNPEITKLFKKYDKIMSAPSPAPLPAPREKKERKPSREKQIVDTFIDLVRLIMGKRPRGEAAPFSEELFVEAVNKVNENKNFKKQTSDLKVVVGFEHPGKEKIFVAVNNGKAEVVKTSASGAEALVRFTEKGWENLQAGDSLYKLFLSGQIKIEGDMRKLSRYTDAFMEMGKLLAK
ncbi:MAG TPA: Gfo/Idh/MocA family oxidoreductase [bacterium]|nr:Gfo/Idh/MocA family oxidoreductase [bacterium]